MRERTNKASSGKRAVVLILGAASFGLSLYLPFVPVRDNLVQIVCKWAVNVLFFVGGLGLIYIGMRGQRKQVDKAVEGLIRGL